MFKKANGIIPERPNRPLVIKCGYEGSTRRVNFPSAQTCRLTSLRTRIEECFALSASPFSLTYTDDDGEEFCIRDDGDLTEAISYFVSGDDDANLSTYSGASNPQPTAFSNQKITIRVEVTVEYDGPSLSDTSSISSFRSGLDDGESQSEGSWTSSGYTESRRSYRGSGLGQDAMEEEEGRTEYGSSIRGSPAHTPRGELSNRLGTLGLSNPFMTDEPISLNGGHGIQFNGRRLNGVAASSSRSSSRDQASATPSSRQSSTMTSVPVTTLTGPDSDPAPSLLTSSELGSRWLREQSSLANTRRLGRVGTPSARKYDSDDDSGESDEESLGDLALVRDARGKYYYSYQDSETSSIASPSEFDYGQSDHQAGPSRSSLTSTPRPLSPLPPSINDVGLDGFGSAEPGGPPILASDCSACGIRLDYMRYVCQTCGEGEMLKENAPGKAAFEPRPLSESITSDGSEDTESSARAGSSGSQTVYGPPRTRSRSISTNASRGSGTASDAGASPKSDHLEMGGNPNPKRQPSLPRGYELCAGCIEVHGIAHTKAAIKKDKASLGSTELRRRARTGESRHTFREKIWGPEGWTDVEYSEDTDCTICRNPLLNDRYKCVSCPKFDLCRTCYQKVGDIHPAHAFLSLPNRSTLETPAIESSRGRDSQDGARKLVRHPGAFCHNCLQDIVGPRFHCAVCPSWDLCIQCEGVAGAGSGSGHTADHIMMKIPVPLASNEVEAVSRRARDRWIQQDSNTVAAAADSLAAPSSRSSSPTNETVYAGGTQRNGDSSPVSLATTQTAQLVRDALDHGCRCNNCGEWIMGRRYQCANCPSDPQGYSLCSICELRSYRIHDPRHVFFKFDRPVHIPLASRQPLLPLLYKSRVGEIPPTAVINARDPTAYLKHVLHRETLCDIHSDQIRGIWLRCAHCAAGFDICQEAEQIADHDPTHVFVVFKARVDMAAFRQLADLAATHSKPLLRNQVYLN